MKGIYFDGAKAVFRDDLKKPVPGPNESLIRILMSAVCNTDKEILKGYKPGFTGIMGHEFVGIVEESDDESLVGKRVVGELNAGCGHCIYCQTGREKHCPDRKVIGLEKKDGCFAEYMTMETHLLHVVPWDLPTELAIFTEPLAAALEIASQVHLKPETNCAIIGDGRLAFLIAQVVAMTGIDLTVIGHHEEKLEQFRPYASVTLEPQESYEVVIEASGSKEGILLAKNIVRHQGMIVLKSTYAGEVSINMSDFVVHEITIKGSRCGPFEPALNLLRKRRITLPEIELYSLESFEKAFSSKAFKSGFAISE